MNRCEHEVPEDFQLRRAESGDTVSCEHCDVSWEVQVDHFTGEHMLTRTEVTQPSSWMMHPLLLGCASMGTLLSFFFAPLVAGAALADLVVQQNPTSLSWGVGYLFGIVSMGVSSMILRQFFTRTRLCDWYWRFDRWQEARRWD
jgi:hypothetical protein